MSYKMLAVRYALAAQARELCGVTKSDGPNNCNNCSKTVEDSGHMHECPEKQPEIREQLSILAANSPTGPFSSADMDHFSMVWYFNVCSLHNKRLQ